MSSPPAGFERRHVVAVEDHLYHTTEMLETMARACAGDAGVDDRVHDRRSWPRHDAAVDGWLRRFTGVQIAARIDPRRASRRTCRAGVRDCAGPSRRVPSFARMVASLLLPGGVLVQDVHLSTLHFIPSDRWWDSIYVAATVRGMFAKRQPAVRFVSNKRGYSATFGRDLMDAGFDPREVMDKVELERVILPSALRDVDERFPLELRAPATAASPVPIAGGRRVTTRDRAAARSRRVGHQRPGRAGRAPARGAGDLSHRLARGADLAAADRRPDRRRPRRAGRRGRAAARRAGSGARRDLQPRRAARARAPRPPLEPARDRHRQPRL